MQHIDVKLTEFSIEPKEIHVKAGEPVEFKVHNDGRIGHDFIIEDLDTGVRNLNAGESKTFEHTFPEPKVYKTACHHLGHEGLGMKGKLIVE